MEKVTREVYSEAVERLIAATDRGTDGSRVTARVLLSAYDGNSYQLDIEDLCFLDPDNYRAAIATIRGRVELSLRPNQVVAGGDQIFADLWVEWKHLRQKKC